VTSVRSALRSFLPRHSVATLIADTHIRWHVSLGWKAAYADDCYRFSRANETIVQILIHRHPRFPCFSGFSAITKDTLTCPTTTRRRHFGPPILFQRCHFHLLHNYKRQMEFNTEVCTVSLLRCPDESFYQRFE
jgi:hypothetical protein